MVSAAQNLGIGLSSLRKICRRHGIHKWPANEQKMNLEKITLEQLEQHFGISMVSAAQNLGIGLSSLRQISRRHGIHRWPGAGPVHCRTGTARPTPLVEQISVKSEADFGGLCPMCILDECRCNQKPMRQRRKAKDLRPTPEVSRIKIEEEGDGVLA
jgi:hypothetical protein